MLLCVLVVGNCAVCTLEARMRLLARTPPSYRDAFPRVRAPNADPRFHDEGVAVVGRGLGHGVSGHERRVHLLLNPQPQVVLPRRAQATPVRRFEQRHVAQRLEYR